MPVHDDETSARFQDCGDGSGEPGLIGDAVKGVCEKHVIDRFRHDRLDVHRVRQDKLAIRPAGNECSGAIEHVGVDVDCIDPACDAAERSREQAVAAAKIDGDHAGLNAHLVENVERVWPQCLPPIGIRHRGRRKEAVIHGG
jgi:hypothetical protein